MARTNGIPTITSSYMIIAVDMPSGTMLVDKPDCIGRWYVLFCKSLNQRFLANCIDATDTGRPKRMRIQQDPVHGGKVLQPADYDIIEADPDWED